MLADKAKESIDRLFAEPFEPQWATRQRLAAEQAEREQRDKWKKLIIERSDLAWRLEAAKAHARLMAKCEGFWYRP